MAHGFQRIQSISWLQGRNGVVEAHGEGKQLTSWQPESREGRRWGQEETLLGHSPSDLPLLTRPHLSTQDFEETF